MSNIQTPVSNIAQIEPNWGLVNDDVSIPVFNAQNETFEINPDLYDSLIDGTPFNFFPCLWITKY